MEKRKNEMCEQLSERETRNPNKYTEGQSHLEEDSSRMLGSHSSIIPPRFVYTTPVQNSTTTWSNVQWQPSFCNPHPSFIRAHSASAHYPGSGEKMCCGIYTAPSSFFENSGWMNVHGHMQFLYMEPTVAESSAVQQSTINSSSQEREIQKNKSRKRQRRTECPVCLKTYARRDTLRVHMRIHKGERPYQCPCCFKTFTQSGNLKVHMRIHSGEKPFACDLCGRRFTQTSGLKSHLEVHKRQ